MTTQTIRQALKSVIDPELGQNIVDLGLIYDIKINLKSNDQSTQRSSDQTSLVSILMTLTTPGCPFGPYFVSQVREVAAAAAGLTPDEIQVDLVFDPPWSQDAMSEELKLQLGL